MEHRNNKYVKLVIVFVLWEVKGGIKKENIFLYFVKRVSVVSCNFQPAGKILPTVTVPL